MPTKKETHSSPMAAPSDAKMLDFYPSLQVEKVLDEDSPNQADHSFNEQGYGDEQDPVLHAESQATEGIDGATTKNNFLEEEDDDTKDIKKALVQLGSSGNDQHLNPFKSRAQGGANDQEMAQKSTSTQPMAVRDDQLFEQMEIDDDFLGGVGDGLEDLRDVQDGPSRPDDLRVQTDFPKDIEQEPFGSGNQNEQVDSGNCGIVDGYYEDFDNQDPEFMKRQMEEYERIQKAFQQSKEGQPRD